jgi:outer membrane protein insertion porin family/translocation and assembly module TamA
LSSRRALALFVLLLAMLAGAGCASIPKGRRAVDAVRIDGVHGVDASEVQEAMATRPNERFLGVAEGFMVDYQLYDPYVLQEDMARIQRFYEKKGFYDAQVRSSEVTIESDDEVAIDVRVDEGAPVLVKRVDLRGFGAIGFVHAQALVIVAEELPLAEPFDETRYQAAEDRIKRLLTDAGYAFAEVKRDATIDLVRHGAWVTLEAKPGPKARFGKVTLRGEGSLPRDKILGALGIEEGAPYSTRTLEEAQTDAFELGVFAAVKITPDLSRPESGVVPIDVEVTPGKLQTVRLGGGVTIDSVKSDVHGLLGWEGRNVFGGMRRLTLEAKPAAVFVPLRINNFVAPTKILPALKLRADFRQPGFIEPRTLGFIRPAFSAQPILLKSDTSSADPILGYAENDLAVGLRRPFGRRLTIELSQNLLYSLPFAYAGDLDPALSQVVLVYPELVTTLDFRNDKIHPHWGWLLSNTFQTALGVDGRDVKTQPEARGYIPVGKRVTLAGRATVGLLFPQTYGKDVADSIQRPFDGGDRAERIHDLQVLYFRGFFSGGGSSNRGYPFAGVGPHGIVPYLNPANGICDPTDRDFDRDVCLSPTGGLTLWEASLEMRIDIVDPFSLAVFCDASDVSPAQVDIRLARPHLSCGPGARVDTPVGPIRLDVGVRIPGMQNLEGPDPLEKEPGDVFGVPLALAFGIGEAF